jgi:hypothetical protein
MWYLYVPSLSLKNGFVHDRRFFLKLYSIQLEKNEGYIFFETKYFQIDAEYKNRKDIRTDALYAISLNKEEIDGLLH